MSKQMTAALDRIERWLKTAPTHPHVEYNTDHHFAGDVVGISLSVVQTWNSGAMLAEWEVLREEIEDSAK